jgi:hypothetical protein
MAQQAMDSFATEIDGAPFFVSKGEILPEGHPVLKQLGKDVPNLFRALAEDKPAGKTAGRPGRGQASG